MALCYLVQLFNQLESGTNLSMCLRALIKGQVGLVTGDRVLARRRRCCLSCRGNGCQSNRGLWRACHQVIAWARVFDLVEVFSFDRGSLWTRVEDLSRVWFASTVSRSLLCCYCLWCWIKSKHYFLLSGFNRFLYIYLSLLLLEFGFINRNCFVYTRCTSGLGIGPVILLLGFIV